MCFHGNQLSWGINHPLISLWSKYRSPAFIRFSTMLAPVISSLDEIYCILQHFLGRPSWEGLVARRQNHFLHKANVTDDNGLLKLVCLLWILHFLRRSFMILFPSLLPLAYVTVSVQTNTKFDKSKREMNFDNSKDSSEGCALNSSKSSQGSCPYFLVLM